MLHRNELTVVILVAAVSVFCIEAVLGNEPTFFPKQRQVWIPRGTAQLLKPYLPKPKGSTNNYRLIVETPEYVKFVTFEKQMGNPPKEVEVEPGEMREGIKYMKHTLIYDVYPGTGFELSLCWQNEAQSTLSYQPTIRAGGTFDWRHFSQTVTPPEGAVYARPLIIKWQKRGISGTFWVDNVVLREEGSDRNLVRAGTFDEPEWESSYLKPEGKDGSKCAKFVCPEDATESQQALWVDPEREPIPIDANKKYVVELDLRAENLRSPSEKPIAALLFRVEEDVPEGKGTILTYFAASDDPPSAAESSELIILPPLKNVRPKEARIAPCMYGMMFGEREVARAYAENAWRSGITWTYGRINNNVVAILWPRGLRVWLAKPGHPFGAHGAARDFLEEHPKLRAIGFNAEPRNALFCPEWLLSAEGEAMRRVMEDALVEHVNRDGYTAVNWDIEQPVLDPPEKGFCFCDRCFAAFRKEANLPADESLNSETILERHKDAWVMFRCRQNATLVKYCHAAVKRCERPIEFSVYSGYQCDRTRVHYGVDWKLLAPHLDLGIAGYGCSREKVRATVEALGAVPFIGGEMYYLSPTNDERPAPRPEMWRNRLLRQFVESGCNGVLIWYLPTMDGAAFYHTSEAAEIIATYEEIFRKGTRCDESFAVNGIKPEHWAAVQHGGKRLLILLNFSEDPARVEVEQTALDGNWKARLHGTPGDLAIDVSKFDHELKPWGTAVFLFQRVTEK